MLAYRKDIDGLRAIAVLAVLGFHISDKYVSGGFVGVDIFFVISGFLITRIIWRDLEADTFSFSTFYAKRIKRLYPALVVMLLGCCCMIIYSGLPAETYAFGQGAIASLFYLSNHFFLSINNYFDASLELNPLLHTWSLSVEEQFYILFPAFLFFLFKSGRSSALYWLSVLFVGSFCLSQYLVGVNESAAFFITPSRFWEFLLGGMIALLPAKNLRSRLGMEALSWLGICMIVFGVFSISDSNAFPGITALWPVLGTGLVIFAGQQPNLVLSRILSVPVARFFGKISYSLYLWHWPLIVFYKLEVDPEPSDTEKIVLVLVSVILGYLSWKFIEETTRYISVEKHKRMIYVSGVVSTCVIAGIALVFILTEGRKHRFSDEELTYIEYLNYDTIEQFRTGSCFLTSEYDALSFFDQELCVQTDPEKFNVLLIGDSHAAQFVEALNEVYPSIELSQITASGCLPVIEAKGEQRCTDLMQMAFKKTVVSKQFDSVILAGRWDTEDVTSAIETVGQLSKFAPRIIVFGPTIEYSQALPRLLIRFGNAKHKIFDVEEYEELRTIDQSLSSAFNDPHVQYYSILDIICPDDNCKLFADNGELMQFDSSHLTKSGSLEIIYRLRQNGLYQELEASMVDKGLSPDNVFQSSMVTR